MKIKIYWEGKNIKILFKKVKATLEELWLNEFIQIETTNNIELKKELNIIKEPALIVEEESIDFKDIIFEWIIPNDEELKSMFISIIWWWEIWDSCNINDCHNCSTWC